MKLDNLKTKIAIGITALVWPTVARGRLPDPVVNAGDAVCILACLACWADAATPLGLLNFCVLQWFGVRLARVTQRVPPGMWWNYLSIDEREAWVRGHTRHKLLRWIWPLTGWWTSYRYIARRS